MGLRSKRAITGAFCLAGLTVLLLTAFADMALFSTLKRSYNETESVIAGIAGTGESGSGLLQYLKEEPDPDWLLSGVQAMASYGYDASAQTVWDRKYQAAKTRIIAASVLIDVLLLAGLACLRALFLRQDAARIHALEHALRSLQTTDFEEADLFGQHLDEVLSDRIQSLQKQIGSDRMQMQQEKESTKSLVTDISHQLKTPVAALKMSLELLSGEELTEPERKEFLAACTHQLNSLENLTESLVGVSRMEQGMIRIQAVQAPVEKTVLSAVSRLYEKAAKRQISIELSGEDKAKTVPVLHDPKWTAEVFVNLLDNAIKYSEPGSAIVIRVEELVCFVRVSVEDSGIGIPKEELPRIFKRFYRGRAVRHLEGSGVGLYLAREIVERQGGILFVHAKGGAQSGSIFLVQLPKG